MIKAASEGLKVIDVDGSYLPRKYERLRQAGLNVAPLDPPSVPPAGWEDVNEDNHKDMAEKIPVVLPGNQSINLSFSLSLSSTHTRNPSSYSHMH